MMTKQHYELLASIIRNHVAAEQLAGSFLGREKILVSLLNAAFRKDNPRFDWKQFWKACGL
jgi:hypothetical protein